MSAGAQTPISAETPTEALLADDCRPRLPRGVRLRHDETRGEWTLLAPERVLKADAIAVEILKRCTGEQTLKTIVDELAANFSADRARVDADVRALLSQLAIKRMVDL